jgi:hypothetical protein
MISFAIMPDATKGERSSWAQAEFLSEGWNGLGKSRLGVNCWFDNLLEVTVQERFDIVGSSEYPVI